MMRAYLIFIFAAVGFACAMVLLKAFFWEDEE